MTNSRQMLAEAVGDAMQRYQRSAQAFDDSVGRRLGLGPADLRCLDWLVDGPKTAGQLSTAVGLKPAATTALIDRLSAKGLIERAHSETDRRQVIVQMSTAGYAHTGALYGPMVADGHQVIQSFTDSELELLARYLFAITELTDRHRARLADMADMADGPLPRI